MVQSDVFWKQGSVASTLGPDHFADPKHARTQHWPYLVLIEDYALAVAPLYFFLECVVEILVEEWYFIEGRAESIL